MHTVAEPAADTPVHDGASYYRLEVQARPWAGALRDGWRPAVAGSLNQTRDDDETASTFATLHEAQSFADAYVVPERPERWRIVRSDGVVVVVVDLNGGRGR